MLEQPDRPAEGASHNGTSRPWEAEALGDLRARCHTALVKMLISRGASPTETEDVLADLWADCVPAADDRPSLLDKFSGRCSLQSWLATVATHRWFDFKRRQERQSPVLPAGDTAFAEAAANLPPVISSLKEDALVTLLHESLRTAFGACIPRQLVLLRLVHIHSLTQREIGRMLGWSESKVSRALAGAVQKIEAETHREIKRRDPWVRINWQDFVDLCETCRLDFM